jgi:hypothetical protein
MKYSQKKVIAAVKKYGAKLRIEVCDHRYLNELDRVRKVFKNGWCYWDIPESPRSWNFSCFWSSGYDLEKTMREMFKYDRKNGLYISALKVGKRVLK